MSDVTLEPFKLACPLCSEMVDCADVEPQTLLGTPALRELQDFLIEQCQVVETMHHHGHMYVCGCVGRYTGEHVSEEVSVREPHEQ